MSEFLVAGATIAALVALNIWVLVLGWRLVKPSLRRLGVLKP
jgi:hypothetical protein